MRSRSFLVLAQGRRLLLRIEIDNVEALGSGTTASIAATATNATDGDAVDVADRIAVAIVGDCDSLLPCSLLRGGWSWRGGGNESRHAASHRGQASAGHSHLGRADTTGSVGPALLGRRWDGRDILLVVDIAAVDDSTKPVESTTAVVAAVHFGLSQSREGMADTVVATVGIAALPISTGHDGRPRNWHDIGSAAATVDIAISGVGPTCIGLGLTGGHKGRGSSTEGR